MKISIVIPAFNEERLIAGTLTSLREGMEELLHRGFESELIVCDNNSTDRTAEISRAAGAKVVFEPINQIARARNRGASAAAGEWLIFVDADSNPDRKLFAEVAEQIASGNCIAGGVTVKLETKDFMTNCGVATWNSISRICHWFAGSFIFCSAEAFRAVGGFSSELFVSEEIDLSKKIKRLARQEKKEVVILHRHPMRTSARKVELYSAGERFRFFFKAILSGNRISRNREDCDIWYDGRR